MLKIGWILLVVVALCWLACEIPLENESSGGPLPKQICWRHTANGWEDARLWHSEVPLRRTEIHPLLVVLLQAAAVAAVAAWEMRDEGLGIGD